MDEFPVSTLKDLTAEWGTRRSGRSMPAASRRPHELRDTALGLVPGTDVGSCILKC